MSKEEGKNEDNKVNKEKKNENVKLNLNDKQKMFVENYLFNGNNGTKAYMLAYGNENYNTCAVKASKLLKTDKIRAEIERREQEIKEHKLNHIAKPEDILSFYTQIMINPDNKLDHRMKAGEYLGKSMGLFNDNQNNNGNPTFTINLIQDEDSNSKSIQFVQQPVQSIEHQSADESDDDSEYVDYEEIE